MVLACSILHPTKTELTQMSTIESEPKPGTAFKTILQEEEMLGQFMTMVEHKYSAAHGLFLLLLT